MEGFLHDGKLWLAALSIGMGATWGALGFMGPVLLVLCCANLIDYLTGLWAAAEAGALSSDKGRRGIYKKLAYWLAIAAALGVDILLMKAAPILGVHAFQFPIICPALAIWLDLNEILSIVENLGRIGVPLPSFLKAIILQLKAGIEKTAEQGMEEEK